MALNEQEAIIQKIVEEWNQEPKDSGKLKLLKAWRAKLEREPPHLAPFQIDEIVREVRRRVKNVSR